MKRLVLIDGNAIMHRAYHALPPLTNRQGQVVNAVYGFCTMLFKVISDLQSSYLAVAFDTEKPTFRHTAYVGYQSHRPRLESDLSEQFDIVQNLMRAFGIPIYLMPGYEADDVIGTIAKKVQGLEVVIVTGDRDLFQLVNDRVKIYVPIKGLTEAKLFDAKTVEEYMGVGPDKIIDYKALVGDTSDNYPGVPGIGPKTAASLIKQYKTFDGIYKALENRKTAGVAQCVLEKLAQGYESGVLSRQLATINTDVPISFDIESAKLPQLQDNEKVIEALKDLGFKSLVARFQTKSLEKQKNKLVCFSLTARNKKTNDDQMTLV